MVLPTLRPVREQVIVITGASSGIGRCAALLLAEEGARIVAIARSQPGLHSLVREIRDKGGDAIYVICDVSKFEEVKKAAQVAIETYGRIDTWVSNAATMVFGEIESLTPEDFKRMMEVNYLGQVHSVLAVLPYMKAQGGGKLIHITSIEGSRGVATHGGYSATKHAVNGFLDALRAELLHDKIPVSLTNIKPAGINTPLFYKGKSKMGRKPRPPPPVYNPEVIAKDILYACTHHSRDMWGGTAAWLMYMGQLLMPSVMDWYMSTQKFYDSNYMSEKRSPNAPNNIYQACPNGGVYDTVKGEWTNEECGSILDWLRWYANPVDWVWGAGSWIAGFFRRQPLPAASVDHTARKTS